MERIVKRIVKVRHIPFHLMKPIRPREIVQCLCADCLKRFSVPILSPQYRWTSVPRLASLLRVFLFSGLRKKMSLMFPGVMSELERREKEMERSKTEPQPILEKRPEPVVLLRERPKSKPAPTAEPDLTSKPFRVNRSEGRTITFN